MPHAEHHIDRRRRVHELNQEYPHPDSRIRSIDRLCMAAAVLMPLTALPQIYKIWRFHVVDGISLWMWILYSILIIPMLIYGFVHKVRQLIVLNILWLLMNAFIITGIFFFR